MISVRQWALLATAATMLSGVAGCGLKGALALPEKSQNVVIRDTKTGATQTTAPTPPKPDKQPPPELPRADSNNPRG
jgi:predicted small lipoprotein YifL